ncbi:thioredoxin-disulfide reductase, partial [Candidatus Roizmanbacteria bacterium RIFCSPHIGHO2_01_FULL_35_10]
MTNSIAKFENVIIIGGGPAGLAAALYTARAGLKPLMFAGSPPGGQLMLTSEVENYPGFESILGPELIQKYRTHVQKFGVRILDQNITKVLFNKSPFTLDTVENSYQAKAVIIATGAKALWLGLENETRLRGKGVSACATCDGFFFKNKVVAVVGGGDTAMEEALTLTKFASKVHLIHRRDQFRASKIMQERVLKNPKIEVLYNTVITDVSGENRV